MATTAQSGHAANRASPETRPNCRNVRMGERRGMRGSGTFNLGTAAMMNPVKHIYLPSMVPQREDHVHDGYCN